MLILVSIWSLNSDFKSFYRKGLALPVIGQVEIVSDNYSKWSSPYKLTMDKLQ